MVNLPEAKHQDGPIIDSIPRNIFASIFHQNQTVAEHVLLGEFSDQWRLRRILFVVQYPIIHYFNDMRRIYRPFSAYFVTTNPKGRYPYFKYSTLCRLFTSILKTSEHKKDFRTIGYKLNPDHIHILLQVRSKYNISEVVHNIKRVSSIAFNKVLDFTDSEFQDKIPENKIILNQLRQDFIKEVGSERFEIPLFKWGKDFDDRLIKSKNQLTRTISYLKEQTKKHELKEDCWLCINDIPCDIRFDDEIP